MSEPLAVDRFVCSAILRELPSLQSPYVARNHNYVRVAPRMLRPISKRS